MKVEYIESFVQAASSVLERVTGCQVETGPLGLLGTTFATGCVNIVTRVDGALHGDAVYSMSSLTAQKLAELLTGAETHGFGRLTGNGLAQLGTQLSQTTGRLLTERGLGCAFSGPTIFQGLNVEFSAAAPALAVPIETDAGRVDVSVAVRNGRQS